MGSGVMMPTEVTTESSPTPARPIDDTEKYEEVPEAIEMPPVPAPSGYDAPQAPLRPPLETATQPEGPELAPPRLMGIQRTGSGLKPGTAGSDAGGGFDWGVVQSQLQPITPAAHPPAPVVPASHLSILKQPGKAAAKGAAVVPARGSSIKVKSKPQPAPTPQPATGWKAAG
jgi:hypothetical protein